MVYLTKLIIGIRYLTFMCKFKKIKILYFTIQQTPNYIKVLFSKTLTVNGNNIIFYKLYFSTNRIIHNRLYRRSKFTI